MTKREKKQKKRRDYWTKLGVPTPRRMRSMTLERVEYGLLLTIPRAGGAAPLQRLIRRPDRLLRAIPERRTSWRYTTSEQYAGWESLLDLPAQRAAARERAARSPERKFRKSGFHPFCATEMLGPVTALVFLSLLAVRPEDVSREGAVPSLLRTGLRGGPRTIRHHLHRLKAAGWIRYGSTTHDLRLAPRNVTCTVLASSIKSETWKTAPFDSSTTILLLRTVDSNVQGSTMSVAQLLDLVEKADPVQPPLSPLEISRSEYDADFVITPANCFRHTKPSTPRLYEESRPSTPGPVARAAFDVEEERTPGPSTTPSSRTWTTIHESRGCGSKGKRASVREMARRAEGALHRRSIVSQEKLFEKLNRDATGRAKQAPSGPILALCRELERAYLANRPEFELTPEARTRFLKCAANLHNDTFLSPFEARRYVDFAWKFFVEGVDDGIGEIRKAQRGEGHPGIPTIRDLHAEDTFWAWQFCTGAPVYDLTATWHRLVEQFGEEAVGPGLELLERLWTAREEDPLLRNPTKKAIWVVLHDRASIPMVRATDYEKKMRRFGYAADERKRKIEEKQQAIDAEAYRVQKEEQAEEDRIAKEHWERDLGHQETLREMGEVWKKEQYREQVARNIEFEARRSARDAQWKDRIRRKMREYHGLPADDASAKA